MLKTRLAEKDAQLMGGFGALSNMQLGGTRGWLGSLPDPESIAAALPDQTRPYIHPHPHPHPSPPRKSAWESMHGRDRLFAGRTSSPKGTSGLPQQLPALVQSADAQMQTAANSAASGWQTQPSRQATEGVPAPGLNAATPGALQQPEGSFKKPGQARPVLLPLSASQNGMPLPPAARSSVAPQVASSRDTFQDESASPAQASTAASAAAEPVSTVGIQSAASLQSFAAGQSAAAGAYSSSNQSSDSGSESEFSETASEASDAAETRNAITPRKQETGSAALDKALDIDQTAALQPPENRSSPLLTSDSVLAATDNQGSLKQQSQDRFGDVLATKSKKKWHIW